MEHVATIGDIDVLADDTLAYIQVDSNIVVAIPREGHGLDELAATLTKLVK